MPSVATSDLLNTYLRLILTAKCYDLAKETALDHMPKLSKRLNCNVKLKREDLQPVFSFKIRGAYNKIAHLSAEQQRAGVITASAGNHAQGVALGATHLGITSIIVMPETTPDIKISSVEGFGGTVVKHGLNFDDAKAHALTLSAEKNMTFIPPFDDPMVIAGQGTIGLEILRQHPGSLDAIFIPVGGGGLLAGVAAAVKSLRPEIKIIGVEPEDAPSMTEALKADRRVMLEKIGIFADGVAVKQVGEENFTVSREIVDDMVLVSTDEICAAVKDIYDDNRAIAEPSGALAVAGLKKYHAIHGASALSGKTVVAINSGANVNFDRLKHVSERADIGEHKEALLAVTIPERKSSFLAFCEVIGDRAITEFNYRYANSDQAHIFVGVQLREGLKDRQHLIEKLQNAGYTVEDMSDNEVAKLHLRHMVGGISSTPLTERLYRFQFPEYPRALFRFLKGLGDWNISLFHYRNHGAAYGRVLVGIQAPDKSLSALESHLQAIGYDYWPEDDNPAYQLFLSDSTGNSGNGSA